MKLTIESPDGGKVEFEYSPVDVQIDIYREERGVVERLDPLNMHSLITRVEEPTVNAMIRFTNVDVNAFFVEFCRTIKPGDEVLKGV